MAMHVFTPPIAGDGEMKDWRMSDQSSRCGEKFIELMGTLVVSDVGRVRSVRATQPLRGMEAISMGFDG